MDGSDHSNVYVIFIGKLALLGNIDTTCINIHINTKINCVKQHHPLSGVLAIVSVKHIRV